MIVNSAAVTARTAFEEAKAEFKKEKPNYKTIFDKIYDMRHCEDAQLIRTAFAGMVHRRLANYDETVRIARYLYLRMKPENVKRFPKQIYEKSDFDFFPKEEIEESTNAQGEIDYAKLFTFIAPRAERHKLVSNVDDEMEDPPMLNSVEDIHQKIENIINELREERESRTKEQVRLLNQMQKLYKEQKYEEALELCMTYPLIPFNPRLKVVRDTYMVDTLYKLKRYQEVVDFCNSTIDIKGNIIIQSLPSFSKSMFEVCSDKEIEDFFESRNSLDIVAAHINTSLLYKKFYLVKKYEERFFTEGYINRLSAFGFSKGYMQEKKYDDMNRIALGFRRFFPQDFIGIYLEMLSENYLLGDYKDAKEMDFDIKTYGIPVLFVDEFTRGLIDDVECITYGGDIKATTVESGNILVNTSYKHALGFVDLDEIYAVLCESLRMEINTGEALRLIFATMKTYSHIPEVEVGVIGQLLLSEHTPLEIKKKILMFACYLYPLGKILYVAYDQTIESFTKKFEPPESLKHSRFAFVYYRAVIELFFLSDQFFESDRLHKYVTYIDNAIERYCDINKLSQIKKLSSQDQVDFAKAILSVAFYNTPEEGYIEDYTEDSHVYIWIKRYFPKFQYYLEPKDKSYAEDIYIEMCLDEDEMQRELDVNSEDGLEKALKKIQEEMNIKKSVTQTLGVEKQTANKKKTKKDDKNDEKED